MNLRLADGLVIILYFAAVIFIGLRFSKRNRTSDRYFLGGRNFPGWAVGLSFIGSTISSVTFIAYPADSFKTAWVRFLPNLAFPLIALAAALFLVPFFRSGKVRSAYHYLSLRFGPSVCLYAASVYLLAQTVRSATIAYLLSVLLNSMTGFGVVPCILLAGGITALYTIKGGFEAVVWTDVVQTVVLIFGALSCIGLVIYSIPGGLFAIIQDALGAGKISFSDLNVQTGELEPLATGFSLREKTAGMLILVGAAQYITGQLDQDSVQRWCAAKSTREARKSMFVLGFGAIPIWAGFMLLGTCLWVYYQHFPDNVSEAILAGSRRAEDILPHFIMTVLPAGVAGLVISGALAAAMASLSSCISAAGMVWVNDLYRARMVKNREDAHYLRAGRASSLVLAVAMMAGAYFFHLANAKTLMELAIIATALFGGGISGAFLFGLFTKRGDHRAVLAGIAATAAFTGYTMLGQSGFVPQPFNSYYTSILSNVVMFTVCWLASLRWPGAHDLKHLTIWDQPARTELEAVHSA